MESTKINRVRNLTQYLLFDVYVCRVVNISTFIGCNRTISMTWKFGCISEYWLWSTLHTMNSDINRAEVETIINCA